MLRLRHVVQPCRSRSHSSFPSTLGGSRSSCFEFSRNFARLNATVQTAHLQRRCNSGSNSSSSSSTVSQWEPEERYRDFLLAYCVNQELDQKKWDSLARKLDTYETQLKEWVDRRREEVRQSGSIQSSNSDNGSNGQSGYVLKDYKAHKQDHVALAGESGSISSTVQPGSLVELKEDGSVGVIMRALSKSHYKVIVLGIRDDQSKEETKDTVHLSNDNDDDISNGGGLNPITMMIPESHSQRMRRLIKTEGFIRKDSLSLNHHCSRIVKLDEMDVLSDSGLPLSIPKQGTHSVMYSMGRMEPLMSMSDDIVSETKDDLDTPDFALLSNNENENDDLDFNFESMNTQKDVDSLTSDIPSDSINNTFINDVSFPQIETIETICEASAWQKNPSHSLNPLMRLPSKHGGRFLTGIPEIDTLVSPVRGGINLFITRKGATVFDESNGEHISLLRKVFKDIGINTKQQFEREHHSLGSNSGHLIFSDTFKDKSEAQRYLRELTGCSHPSDSSCSSSVTVSAAMEDDPAFLKFHNTVAAVRLADTNSDDLRKIAVKSGNELKQKIKQIRQSFVGLKNSVDQRELMEQRVTEEAGVTDPESIERQFGYSERVLLVPQGHLVNQAMNEAWESTGGFCRPKYEGSMGIGYHILDPHSLSVASKVGSIGGKKTLQSAPNPLGMWGGRLLNRRAQSLNNPDESSVMIEKDNDEQLEQLPTVFIGLELDDSQLSDPHHLSLGAFFPFADSITVLMPPWKEDSKLDDVSSDATTTLKTDLQTQYPFLDVRRSFSRHLNRLDDVMLTMQQQQQKDQQQESSTVMHQNTNDDDEWKINEGELIDCLRQCYGQFESCKRIILAEQQQLSHHHSSSLSNVILDSEFWQLVHMWIVPLMRMEAESDDDLYITHRNKLQMLYGMMRNRKGMDGLPILHPSRVPQRYYSSSESESTTMKRHSRLIGSEYSDINTDDDDSSSLVSYPLSFDLCSDTKLYSLSDDELYQSCAYFDAIRQDLEMKEELSGFCSPRAGLIAKATFKHQGFLPGQMCAFGWDLFADYQNELRRISVDEDNVVMFVNGYRTAMQKFDRNAVGSSQSSQSSSQSLLISTFVHEVDTPGGFQADCVGLDQLLETMENHCLKKSVNDFGLHVFRNSLNQKSASFKLRLKGQLMKSVSDITLFAKVWDHSLNRYVIVSSTVSPNEPPKPPKNRERLQRTEFGALYQACDVAQSRPFDFVIDGNDNGDKRYHQNNDDNCEVDTSSIDTLIDTSHYRSYDDSSLSDDSGKEQSSNRQWMDPV